MALNIAGLQRTPDIVGNFQRGQVFGQQQRQLEQQRADQQQLRNLTPQVIAGDPNAYSQAAAIDLESAGKAQAAGDTQARRIEGLLNYLDQVEKTNGPEAVQRVYQTQAVPFLRQFSQGTEPTPNWAEAKPLMEQVRGRIATAKAGQNASDLPTGYRQLDLAARAAGFEPGTPEYQNYFRVAGGIEGRAPSGGFGFEVVPGVGLTRRNPRTGQVEVYDQTTGDFTAVGSGAALNAGQPAPAGAVSDVGQVAPVGSVSLEGATPQQNQQVGAVAQFMAAQGIPQPQIDAWVASQNAALGGQAPAPMAPPAARQPSPAVARFGDLTTRTPEEQAFLNEQAKREAELNAYSRATGLEAERESAVTTAREGAQARAAQQFGTDESRKSAKEASAKLPQLNNAIRGLTRIDNALTALEGGVLGDTGPIDQYAQRLTKEGQELEASVGGIQNSVLALTRVPGVGSQSDLEARVAALQYPSLDRNPQTNRATLNNLRLFLQDLQQAYQNVIGSGQGAAPAAQQPGGWGIRRVK